MAFLHSNDSHTFIKLPVFCRLEAVFFMMCFKKKKKLFIIAEQLEKHNTASPFNVGFARFTAP